MLRILAEMPGPTRCASPPGPLSEKGEGVRSTGYNNCFERVGWLPLSFFGEEAGG